MIANEISRRDLLGATAGAVVAGWNPDLRRWVTTRADEGDARLDEAPPLDGVLVTDPASRSLAADDFGNIVHRQPAAVLRPLSAEDVVKIVRFARARQIKVSMRGQGHSVHGQSQVQDGIQIDSATLNRIHSINSDRAVVEPGVLWRTLILQAAARDVTPPILADYQDLSVGGTLSLGGHQAGAPRWQVDEVLELRVVTGTGELVDCSPTSNRRLFRAVLAGLGQCGIIVRATLRMVPMPASALSISLHYDDLATCMADHVRLLREQRFDDTTAAASWQGGRWVHRIDAGLFFNPPATPDHRALFAGLSDDASRRTVTPMPYVAWPFRMDPLIGVARAARPASRYAWFAGAIPGPATLGFLEEFFGSHTIEDVGGDTVFVFGGVRRRAATPLLKLPKSELFFILFLGRRAGSDAEAAVHLADNRVLYDRLVALGGKRYPFDAIPDLSRRDWKVHYGSSWNFLKTAKRRFDPANILGSGQGIFR
jgi:cytokinin dehydrogenase